MGVSPARTAGGARLRASPRLPPWALGVAIFATLLIAYVVLDALLAFAGEARASPWHRSDVGTAAIVALLTGYAFTAAGYARSGVEQCMRDLRRVLCCSAGEQAALERAALAFFSHRPSFAAVTGAVIGLLVFDGGVALGLRGGLGGSRDLVWWIPTEAILFGMIGGGVWSMVRVTRYFSWLGENIDTADPFDVQALAPFAHFGLRSALLWIVGTSIASLLFLHGLAGRATAVVAAILAGILAMAILTLLLPIRGVRRRIRSAKVDELARVQAAIRRERTLLLESGSSLSGEGNATMASLLAYRQYVESIREWPLDARTLARFALYVSIGLGSWVGAAVVERLLDVLLS